MGRAANLTYASSVVREVISKIRGNSGVDGRCVEVVMLVGARPIYTAPSLAVSSATPSLSRKRVEDALFASNDVCSRMIMN